MMEKAGFLNQIGRENICAIVDLALERSRGILDRAAIGENDRNMGSEIEC